MLKQRVFAQRVTFMRFPCFKTNADMSTYAGLRVKIIQMKNLNNLMAKLQLEEPVYQCSMGEMLIGQPHTLFKGYTVNF